MIAGAPASGAGSRRTYPGSRWTVPGITGARLSALAMAAKHSSRLSRLFLPLLSGSRAEVRQRTATLGRAGGYIIAPSHNIQPDTPE